MCFVSLMTGGLEIQRPPYGSLQAWPQQQVLEFAEIIRRLDRIDKVLGLNDCKDEAKEKFLEELDALVQKYLQQQQVEINRKMDVAAYPFSPVPGLTALNENVLNDGHSTTCSGSSSAEVKK